MENYLLFYSLWANSMLMNKLVLLAVSVAIGLAGCSKPAENTQSQAEPTPVVAAPQPAKKQEGKRISVPSDANAEFYVLDKAKKGSQSIIITKRVGSSGESYSSRLYDCADNTVKYIGTGETRQAMEQSSPDPNMSPIVEGSIAYYVGVVACK